MPARFRLKVGIVWVCGTMLAPIARSEWVQDAHDAQRTGATPESADLPWSFLWAWNACDAQGGLGGRRYQGPHESRPITGGAHIYVAAGALDGEGDGGLYALRKCDGVVAWQRTNPAFDATPAYHVPSGTLLAGGRDGVLYQFAGATGQVLGTYDAGGPINKSVLIAGDVAYVVTEAGVLHSVDIATLAPRWVYTAGSPAATPPAYDAAQNVLVFCTTDLYVHAVNGNNGTQRWRVKPSPNTPGGPPEYFNTFEFSWPVMASGHGLVLVHQTTRNYDDLWGPGPMGRYPNTNAEIRAYLASTPSKQNLFALDLADGSVRFLPAVGPGYLEIFSQGGVVGGIAGCQPVVRRYADGTEVAYQLWRCGQTSSNGNEVDGRWDSQVGEMVLDDQTIPGLAAGDLRRVQWIDDFVITDEQGPLTMAADTLFYAHWAFAEQGRISDRGPSRGLDSDWNNPIQITLRPSLCRWIAASGTPNVQTHWYDGNDLYLFGDGRHQPGPGWWGYWNVWGPDSGYANRYTVVSDGLVIFAGGGGDLFVFAHSGGGATPTILVPPSDTTAPVGGSASLSVAASGPGRSYQWYHNGDPLVDTPRLSGSNAAVLTITGVLPSDAGNYAVSVSNACGTVTSPPAVLLVTGSLSGDTDLDGDVDLRDFARFQGCYALSPTGACAVCDWTLDGAIDLADWAVWVTSVTGPL